jgi:hypothetical protein
MMKVASKGQFLCTSVTVEDHIGHSGLHDQLPTCKIAIKYETAPYHDVCEHHHYVYLCNFESQMVKRASTLPPSMFRIVPFVDRTSRYRNLLDAEIQIEYVIMNLRNTKVSHAYSIWSTLSTGCYVTLCLTSSVTYACRFR